MEIDRSMGEREKKPASVRVSPEFHKELIALKEATGASIEYLVRSALKAFLAQPKNKRILRAHKAAEGQKPKGSSPDAAHFLPAASGMSGRR
jgi:hypothetical protein